MSSSWTRERSKIGVIAREIKRGERPADDPALDEAKRGLAAVPCRTNRSGPTPDLVSQKLFYLSPYPPLAFPFIPS